MQYLKTLLLIYLDFIANERFLLKPFINNKRFLYRKKQGLIITEDKEETKKIKRKEIKYVPAWKWLLQ